jgi:hypothetical protein
MRHSWSSNICNLLFFLVLQIAGATLCFVLCYKVVLTVFRRNRSFSFFWSWLRFRWRWHMYSFFVWFIMKEKYNDHIFLDVDFPILLHGKIRNALIVDTFESANIIFLLQLLPSLCNNRRFCNCCPEKYSSNLQSNWIISCK